jgi:spore coat polysaccharide biosynthesis predicted glycosyltransferase SpsG
LCDLNIVANYVGEETAPQGLKLLLGLNYLVLNADIVRYKRQRTRLDSIVITMGGSDTYGVTLEVAKAIQNYGAMASIIIGPGFDETQYDYESLGHHFKIIKNVPSLMEEFFKHDIAITAGGITPFEAAASGLPTIVVANEVFEVKTGLLLESLGCSRYAGYRTDIPFNFEIEEMDIEQLSSSGPRSIDSLGSYRIASELEILVR